MPVCVGYGAIRALQGFESTYRVILLPFLGISPKPPQRSRKTKSHNASALTSMSSKAGAGGAGLGSSVLGAVAFKVRGLPGG